MAGPTANFHTINTEHHGQSIVLIILEPTLLLKENVQESAGPAMMEQITSYPGQRLGGTRGFSTKNALFADVAEVWGCSLALLLFIHPFDSCCFPFGLFPLYLKNLRWENKEGKADIGSIRWPL